MHRTRTSLVALTGCLIALPSAGAQAQTRAAAAAALARAGDAVVTIVAYRDGTSEVTSGTGVRVTDGRVLTALRHLRGASRAEVFGANGDLLANVTVLDQAEVKLDLAVLPRIAALGNRMTLSRRSAVLTQKVNLLGPKTGTIRSVRERTVTHVEPDGEGRPLLRLGVPVTSSAAGSPVVNARSELVAIALGTIPGKEDGDLAVDVSAIRELLARPAVRLALPARDGSITAARAPADAGAASGSAAVRPAEPVSSPRTSVFPERYGAPISADTAGRYAVELFGCARLESRKKIYCYLRVTNLAQQATFAVNGGDLTDSTRKKLREAANLLVGETTQQVSGWRNKAEVPLRELESARIALEFEPPAKEGDAVRLMLDVAGERTLWLGPFVLQRAP
ncbi:MAG: hypothetical protein U5K74_08380 [Gemmatimonadaceae bacterium]|nr:hypothetical protein [Gemmatimonadaceae bacterium]